jgi:hypothetical protein
MSSLNKYDANRIADEFVEQCIRDGVIQKIIDPEVGITNDDINPQISSSFLERPDLKYTWEESGELTVFTEVDGVKTQIVVDPAADNMKTLETYITDSLPDPPFSIDCGGVKTKQIEAKAFYVLCVLNKFRSDSFKTEIKSILESYDFKNMRSNDGTMKFKALLEDKMLENTKVLDLVVACCYLKLTAAEVKKDSALRDVLESSDVQAYDALKALIKSNTKITDLNKEIERNDIKKWERNRLIDERSAAIDSIVKSNDDRLVNIYAVFNQSTDKISQPLKDKILAKSKERISELKTEYGNLDDYEADLLLSKIKRRAMREQLRQIQARQLQRIKNNDWDNLIPKT